MSYKIEADEIDIHPSVKIGKNVKIKCKSIKLGEFCIIGDNVVIGTNSIINRDLPDGCLAAGTPCKVIREGLYPRPLNDKDLKKLVEHICSDWIDLCISKGITRNIEVWYEKRKIFLNQNSLQTIYYLDDRKIEGHTNDVSEDLRDYLRRRGIKIYTDRFFKSI